MEGQIVSHYRVLARLGGGGMGVVYRAEDTRLKRTVALKFLPPDLTRDPEARERFVQEAQAASALDHPNICTIYDADSDAEGRLFIAMAYYEGATLKERLSGGPLPVLDALDHALQVARGLGKAHDAGIVHRDIKPANLMVTRDGLVKIVDFGIAKLLDRTGPTRTGTTVGTVAYMAPEQLEGKSVDRRADLWALGVVLYEMLTGQRPFGGDREMAIIHNILDTAPPPARVVRPDIPLEVDRLLTRALTKEPGGRFQTAAEFIEALTACLPSSTAAVTVPRDAAPSSSRSGRRLIAVAVSVAVLAAAGTAAWFMRRASQAQRVDALVTQISRLADADDFAPALAALEEAERLAPADARLHELAPRISDTRDIVTTPAGASVFVKPYDDVTQPWKLLGRTPMTRVRLAREVFRWKVELAGYEPLEVLGPSVRTFPPLVKAGQFPPNTLVIGRGPVNLSMAGYNYSKQLPAGSFLIDKLEVTNRQYKAFVDAGGYRRREYWKEIVRDGHTVPWDAAMSEFRDRTGRPGPATWEVGTYLAGQEDYPVTGVSWYEADAFATFSKRSLPTVYHWLRASGVGLASYIAPLSNLKGTGPAPVGRFTGLSQVGAMDMAGNAKEWCANEVSGTHKRYILGGSWRDAVHMFYQADARAPFDRSEDNGFRLATYLDAPIAATLSDPIPVPTRNFTAETPASDQMFSAFLRQYAYDPRPLDARVEARDESAPAWVREKVSFRAAYGDDRVVAYVFFPRHVKPPFQTIVYAPAASALTNRGFDVASGGDFNSVDYLILSGRAVVYPVYAGTYERNTGQTTAWPDRTRAYQDWMVQIVNDARRTVDYLESRPDIRRDGLAFVGASWGATFAPRILAHERRFKTAVITDGGFTQATEILPELDSFNYVPRVTLPLLMINGDGDFLFPVETAQRPFFDLLGTRREQKRKVTFQGGHYIIQQQRNQVVREVLGWLDQHVGTVEALGSAR